MEIFGKRCLVQYIRRQDKRPIGVVVAIPDINNQGEFSLRVSVCNSKDRFSKKSGLALAFGRAVMKDEYVLPIIEQWMPISDEEEIRVDIVQETMERVLSRAKKYYGNNKNPKPLLNQEV